MVDIEPGAPQYAYAALIFWRPISCPGHVTSTARSRGKERIETAGGFGCVRTSMIVSERELVSPNRLS